MISRLHETATMAKTAWLSLATRTHQGAGHEFNQTLSA
ncbi:hypothetical protein VC87395_002510 [Vibrio paracholerae 87395]|nr:hypothetical protein VC87395_002510 [Vibrio paracholerae 87395]